MTILVPYVTDMINRPDTNKAFATSSLKGEPHIIVSSTLEAIDSSTLILAELKMIKTGKNLEENPIGAFTVWRGKQAYTIYVKVESRLTSGPHYDRLKEHLEGRGIPMFAIWVFKVVSVQG